MAGETFHSDMNGLRNNYTFTNITKKQINTFNSMSNFEVERHK